MNTDVHCTMQNTNTPTMTEIQSNAAAAIEYFMTSGMIDNLSGDVRFYVESLITAQQESKFEKKLRTWSDVAIQDSINYYEQRVTEYREHERNAMYFRMLNDIEVMKRELALRK